MKAMVQYRDNIEAILIEAVCMCADMDGWANLPEVGTYLRKSGVKYGKLSEFLDEYSYLIDRRINNNVNPPSIYIKLINPPQ